MKNVLYLHCHDAGRSISPYGHALPTPHLADFATRATVFRQAYCAGPTCSPSRAGLLTGQWAHESGMLGLAHRGFRLAHPERHLAHFLRERGFLTVLSGVQHEFAWNAPKPYEIVHPFPPRAQDRPVGDATIDQDLAAGRLAADFLRGHDCSRPFFLSCGFILPHREFPTPTAADHPAHLPPPAGLPDTPEVRSDLAAYRAGARAMDSAAGLVLDALRETGLDGQTLVIFTTDHGIAFPWHKCNLYDTGMGVALLLGYPGNPLAGQALDALVSQVDLFPTVCDFLGLPPPAWLRGHSLRPLLEGAVSSVRDELFSEVTYHAAYEPLRAVRTTRHKLIRRFGDRHPVLPNVDDSPSKSQVMRDGGWIGRTLPEFELYDLLLDPAERRNLADDPSARPLLEQMRARLDRWMRETADPLLHGPVPPPPGSKVNRADGYSPGEPPEQF